MVSDIDLRANLLRIEGAESTVQPICLEMSSRAWTGPFALVAISERLGPPATERYRVRLPAFVSGSGMAVRLYGGLSVWPFGLGRARGPGLVLER